MSADPMGDMLIDLLAGTARRFDGLNVKNAELLIDAYRSSRHDVAGLRAALKTAAVALESAYALVSFHASGDCSPCIEGQHSISAALETAQKVLG